MRCVGLMCLLAALACGCDKKSTPPSEPLRHDSKIDGSGYATQRALNDDEVIQDQVKVSKNYQKTVESAPKANPPASAPAVASAPAEKPLSTPAKPTAVASSAPATPAKPSAPADAAAPAVTTGTPPPAAPSDPSTPTGVTRRMLRQQMRDGAGAPPPPE